MHWFVAGPEQNRHEPSHASHTPLLLNAWKPQLEEHWPVSVTTKLLLQVRHALDEAELQVAHGLLHAEHTPRLFLK